MSARLWPAGVLRIPEGTCPGCTGDSHPGRTCVGATSDEVIAFLWPDVELPHVSRAPVMERPR